MNVPLSRRGFLGGVPLLLAGCLSTPTITPARYYTLNIDARPEPAPPSDRTLGIRPLAGARPYKLDVAYKSGANRLEYFTHAEWAETPPAVVGRALTDGIRATGMFKDVGDAADMSRPDYILTGELRRFEADYTVSPPSAVVELSVAIRPTTLTGTFWEGLVRADSPIAGLEMEKNADAIASAMAEAVSALILDVCARIRGSATAP